MAKITIEELYRGDKYNIMGAVAVKAMMLGIDERTEEGQTWIEMELIRQTVIAIEPPHTETVTASPSSPSAIQSPFFFICSIAITV